MEFLRNLSIFEILTGTILILASIVLTLQIKKEIPSDLHREFRRPASLIFLFFAGYLFIALVQLGNISYPLEPIITSLFLGSACFVYAVVILTKNFTARIRRAEEALLMLEKAAKTTRTGITVRGRDGRIIFTNPADAEMHGYTPDELVGRDPVIFAPPDCADGFALDGRGETTTWVRESVNVRKDGSTFPVRLASDVVRDDGGKIIGIVTNCEDITEKKLADEELKQYQGQLEKLVRERTGKLSEIVSRLKAEIVERKKKEEQIKYLAYHDGLTGLPNRLLVTDRLNQAIKHAARVKKMVAVLFLDLDNFKRVNDTLGHVIGDQLLKSVAERLTSGLREGDSVVFLDTWEGSPWLSRLGGDEFLVVLPDIEGLQGPAAAAQRILGLLAQPFTLDGREIFMTASVGVTVFPQDGEDADTLLKNADTAMYHAKEEGRNSYQFFAQAMNAEVCERLAMENGLRNALKREEFLLHYQPQVNIKNGQMVGVESLLRWNHPDRGLVQSGYFIPVAEESGMIIPIGEWTLGAACRQLHRWLKDGVAPVRLAVNICSCQFMQKDLVETVKRVLDENGIEPGLLDLEITESSIMKNAEQAVKTLSELKKIGVRVSIDDFGTGYSSLSYLGSFPIDTLKVDQSFVRDVTTNPDAAAITRTIIAMAHNLNLNVIAEGVETKEQMEFLQDIGCEMMQGYLFGRPLPPDEIAVMMRKLPLAA